MVSRKGGTNATTRRRLGKAQAKPAGPRIKIHTNRCERKGKRRRGDEVQNYFCSASKRGKPGVTLVEEFPVSTQHNYRRVLARRHAGTAPVSVSCWHPLQIPRAYFVPFGGSNTAPGNNHTHTHTRTHAHTRSQCTKCRRISYRVQQNSAFVAQVT